MNFRCRLVKKTGGVAGTCLIKSMSHSSTTTLFASKLQNDTRFSTKSSSLAKHKLLQNEVSKIMMNFGNRKPVCFRKRCLQKSRQTHSKVFKSSWVKTSLQHQLSMNSQFWSWRWTCEPFFLATMCLNHPPRP